MLFEQLIGLLSTRPMVPGKIAECLRLWETFTARQQQQIYDTISTKLQTGKFVHYDPIKAIQDNSPKVQIISADEYYRRYGTQANQDGWVRTFLPEQQKTIYVNYGKSNF